MIWKYVQAVLVILGLSIGLLACEQASDNAGSVSGSGVDINCRQTLTASALPNAGVGDTRVQTDCGSSSPE